MSTSLRECVGCFWFSREFCGGIRGCVTEEESALIIFFSSGGKSRFLGNRLIVWFLSMFYLWRC